MVLFHINGRIFLVSCVECFSSVHPHFVSAVDCAIKI